MTELMKHVDALHSSGIFHGDIKPLNIMIVDSVICQVKLIDFGGATTERFGTFTIGTPDYCAPEAMNHCCFDKRSADVFSVGKVLDFLIKNRRFQTPGLDNLVKRMTSQKAEARPSLQQALARLSLGELLQDSLLLDFLQSCTKTKAELLALLCNEQTLQNWLAAKQLMSQASLCSLFEKPHETLPLLSDEAPSKIVSAVQTLMLQKLEGNKEQFTLLLNKD